MGLGNVKTQVNGVIGFGTGTAMHHQYQFGLADLQQQFGLGPGRLDHNHPGFNALAVGASMHVGGAHAVVHGATVYGIGSMHQRPARAFGFDPGLTIGQAQCAL